MKKLILIMLIVSLCLVGTVTSADELVFKQDTVVDLKIPCFNNNSFCSASATCNITILYPNGSVLDNNRLMSNHITYHNYTLNRSQTVILGIYTTSITCIDGGDKGYSTPIYNITPTGRIISTSETALYITLLIGMVVFLIICLSKISSNDNYGWSMGLASLSYILLISVLFISYQLALNFLFSISYITSILYILFLITLICFFPFFIILIIYLLSKVAGEREIKALVDIGYSSEEAKNLKKRK